MRFNLRYFLFSLLILSIVSINAQEPYSKHFTVPSGLPANAVYALLEDHQGFIWFTCDEGLYRYDGNHFQAFRQADQTSYSGSGLLEDKLGRIWYQNFDGKTFYTENGKLKAFAPNVKANYFPVRSTEKHLFYLDQNQLVVADLHTLKRVKAFPIGSLNYTSTIFQDHYYFISSSTLFKITPDLQLQKVAALPIEPTDYPILFSDERSIYLTKKSSPQNGILKIDERGCTPLTQFSSELIVQNARVINTDIYVQTTQGVYVISSASGRQKNSFFHHQNISDMLLDRKNNYWFSSTINGIFLVPDLGIQQYEYPDLAPLHILPIDDKLLITTKKEQIAYFHPTSNSFTTYYQGNNNAEVYYAYYAQAKDELVYVMSDGYTYFGSSKFPNHSSKIKFAIKQIAKIDDKYNAFVSSGFIGFYHAKKDSSIPSSFDKYLKPLPQRMEKDYVFYQIDLNEPTIRGKAIEYDNKKNTIYFATNSGLFIWKNGKISEQRSGNKTIILRDMFQWNNTVFGFGANGNLLTLSPKAQRSVTNNNVLFQNKDIKQVNVYSDKLILRTAQFLKVYTIENNGQTKLNSKFDISNIECNDFTLLHNTVWIVAANGLIKWDITEEVTHQQAGLFVIIRFAINDEAVTQRMKRFTYDQNNITIDFALLDFGIKSIESVYYQLNDQAWKLVDPTVRTLNFASLSPGNYTVRFKGLIRGKFEQFENIQFEIRPPFWSTTWFLSILFIGILLLAVVYFTYQIRTIRTRNALVNEKLVLESDLNKSLLSSIKSQMNPHFIFNALNTIQAYIFINDKQNATSYLSKFSKLTRAILEMSEKDEVILSEELNTLRLYLDLEKMRFQEGFHYEIKTENLNIESIKIPSMLIQPYVENAVKHGLLHSTGDKRIVISIHLKENQLIVEIDDNGIGRKRAEELRKQRDKYHEGFSTQANEKRLRLLSHNTHVVVNYTDKYNEHGQAIGTTVQLTIHLKK